MPATIHRPETLFMFADRRGPAAFWLGALLTVIGVLLHLPMFLMARSMHYRMAGMPMGTGMLCGMALVIGGIAAALYGLRPKEASTEAATFHERIVAPEDAPLTAWHWIAGGALVMALVVDTMKISSPGFVIPGMRVEYGYAISRHHGRAQRGGARLGPAQLRRAPVAAGPTDRRRP
jgi:MFS transporter, putative metabolite:H+ symporter